MVRRRKETEDMQDNKVHILKTTTQKASVFKLTNLIEHILDYKNED